MRQLILLLLSFFVLASFELAQAQNSSSVYGVAIDSATAAPLKSATASIMTKDGKILGGDICDSRGQFSIQKLPSTTVFLVVTSLGYKGYSRMLTLLPNDSLKVGTIRLAQSSIVSEGIEVEATQIRGEQKGDTTEFNAKSFKTDKNASAEDLVRKMPGVEIENGQVKAQGEQVKRVLVDGKAFFGDDAATTLKTLPSDIIDKVQVYDQGSDQAQFTRFDDGERNKTINVVTKVDKRKGQFGKIYAGYGTNDRYNAGGNINFFNGDQRISLLLMSNNINEQNFSMQDIMGAMGGGGNQMMRMAGRSMAMFTTSGGGKSSTPRSYGGGGGSDFTVSQSDGISESSGIGLNYSDQFGKSFALTGSYFFNRTNTSQVQTIDKLFYLSENNTQLNALNNDNRTINANHRVNLRADVSIDSMSSILFSPRLTWQSNEKSLLGNSVTASALDTLNLSKTNAASNGSAYNYSSDLLYRLRFATEGRTFSANISGTLRHNDGTANNTSENTLFALDTNTFLLNQFVPSDGESKIIGANLNYTEPIATNHQLQLTYNVNNSHTESTKNTRNRDSLNNLSDPIAALSNQTSSDYLTHRPGISYRFSIVPPVDTSKPKFDPMMMMMGGDKAMGSRMMGMMGGAVGTWTFGIGTDYQVAKLSTDQTFPVRSGSSTNFYNFLPNISIVARPSVSSNIRFNYRTSTNSPGIQQLQDVLDNSDPLRLYLGNSKLKQEYNHSIFANYGSFNIVSASGLFAMVYVNLTSDKIVNSTLTRGKNPISGDSIRAGTQFITSVNRDGYVNASSFLVYSFPFEPVKGFKLNINSNAGVVYTKDISLIDAQENQARTWVLTPSLGFSSNISEYTDFSISARSAYTTLNNSIQRELNSSFYTTTLIARATFISHDSSDFLDGWLLNGDMNYIVTSGLASAYNRAVPLLNFGLGKRFLDGRAELKLSVFDALNRNNTINRTTGSGYVEDAQTRVLQRYFLLTLTYNLRIFGK